MILLKLDIISKEEEEEEEGEKRNKPREKMENRESHGIYASAHSFKATPNLRVQSITGRMKFKVRNAA